MEYVLQTEGLTKVFGKRAAVNGINLNVRKGDIYGFIGRNGAGKTTLIRMVAGLAKITRGNITLFEEENLDFQRGKTGTMIENPAVFPHMTAKQNLHYYALLLGLDTKKEVEEKLALVGLQNTGKKKAKNFSLGMKQRLAIAIALLGDPEFLMLDEPINGLDPSGIKEIRELILRLNQERKITILISSHILGELSKIATRYGVINNGVMVTEFTNEDLHLYCKGVLEIKVDDAEAAKKVVEEVIDPGLIELIDQNTLYITDELDKAGIINMELAKNSILVHSSAVIGQDLEAYFMQLMESTDQTVY